jgi:hypothetical protein
MSQKKAFFNIRVKGENLGRVENSVEKRIVLMLNTYTKMCHFNAGRGILAISVLNIHFLSK